MRNPTVTRSTWRQKRPIIQRRLDYWLVSDCLQGGIDSVDIKMSIKSDHSAIIDDSMYDYITQGAIIRSRATWYELTGRNNKYFLNLENSKRKKSTVRNVFNREVGGVTRIFSELRKIPQIN